MLSGWSDGPLPEFRKHGFLLLCVYKKPLKINAKCELKTGIDLAIWRVARQAIKKTRRRFNATNPIQPHLILPTPDAHRRSLAPARFCLTPLPFADHARNNCDNREETFL